MIYLLSSIIILGLFILVLISESEKKWFQNFISFRLLITSYVLPYIYYFVAAIIILFGCFLPSSLLVRQTIGIPQTYILSIFILIFGNLIWRIIIEFMVNFFSISELKKQTEILEKLKTDNTEF